jgi:ADP-ribose pyrophosphatase YjhB (NUDIX family)
MFNIRVYGLLLKESHVLLTTEDVKGLQVTKFPGGGLESGEGTIDCLKREFHEELNLRINILKHLYTTDFYVQSFFNTDDQILSIYYAVEETEKRAGLQEFPHHAENNQHFFWMHVDTVTPDMFYFPIDKVVINMIKAGQIIIPFN